MAQFKATEGAARVTGLTTQSLGVTGPEGFDAAFEAARRMRAQGLIILSSLAIGPYRTRLADLALTHRLLAISINPRFADAEGGLMAYGPDVSDMFRRAAGYVDRILRSARPADLPVQRPARFELVINEDRLPGDVRGYRSPCGPSRSPCPRPGPRDRPGRRLRRADSAEP